jgi:hypothetical protein
MSLKISYAQYTTKDVITIDGTRQDSQGVDYKAGGEWDDVPAHPDLRKACDRMGLHLAILCGYIKTSTIPDIKKVKPSVYEGFHITGYQYTGKETDKKVMLTGYYHHDFGATTLNTKSIRLADEGENAYVFIEHFINQLNHLESEFLAFEDGSKRGAVQGDLFTQQQPVVNKIQIDEPVPSLVPTGMALTAEGNRLQQADKDAMERVQAWDHTGEKIDVVEEPVKEKSKRRVAQSPENKSGIVDPGA